LAGPPRCLAPPGGVPAPPPPRQDTDRTDPDPRDPRRGSRPAPLLLAGGGGPQRGSGSGGGDEGGDEGDPPPGPGGRLDRVVQRDEPRRLDLSPRPARRVAGQ